MWTWMASLIAHGCVRRAEEFITSRFETGSWTTEILILDRQARSGRAVQGHHRFRR